MLNMSITAIAITTGGGVGYTNAGNLYRKDGC
mgnify:CR=1 FL=1